MAIEIKVPRLGWNMEQGTFLGWIAREGEPIKVGEPLFTLEGDKAVQDIEATDAGVLRIAADGPRVNDIVPVGKVIGFLAAVGESIVSKPEHDAPASPSVRRLAREMGVDLAHVQGSASGRITQADLRAHQSPPAARPDVSPRRQQAITPRARRAAAKRGLDWKHVTGTGRDGRIRERDIVGQATKRPAPTNTRRVIAERMVHSLRNTAPVTLTTTADATNLVNLRQQFRVAAGTILPTFTDFIVKLTAIALQTHLALNSRWEDDGIFSSPEVHMGIAADSEAGLLVPVIRNVETLTLRQLATRSKELLDRTRARRLTADEMQGGTFTVSNLGGFGIDAFTPIINWPQCAILGVGRIEKLPAVVEGQIVARDRLTLSLTFDHRLVDGAPAARFLQALVRGIENPDAWLVG